MPIAATDSSYDENIFHPQPYGQNERAKNYAIIRKRLCG